MRFCGGGVYGWGGWKIIIIFAVVSLLELIVMKKVGIFVFQVIVTTIIYTGVLYLWYLFDHDAKEFDWGLFLQGLIFSLLYVPFSDWWRKKKI